MVMVLVGAINVSATETVWHGLVTTTGSRIQRFSYADEEIRLKRGDEMGRFNLGSTVILITTEYFKLAEHIEAGAVVYMGGNIGRATDL